MPAGASGSRTLITGGAGFLGSHLCDRLIAEGHHVVCLDSLLTGRADNVAHLREHPNFSFHRHDVTEPIDLEEILTGHEGSHGLDYVLHLASPASPKDYSLHPIHTLKVGALGTYHALGLAKAMEATFLLASSSEVYGDPEVSPQPESYYGHVNPVGPRSVYDEAKRFAEAIASAYRNEHGLVVRIARIFNTYGPRMRVDDGRAIPTFMTQAIRDQPLTVFGDGSQTRSFCYVDDTIDGLYRLLTYLGPPAVADSDGLAAAADPDPFVLNIGNPEEVTVLHVAREIVEAAGSNSEITFAPLPEDDPKTRRPDISLARRLLGWAPRIGRDEGLRRLMPYFKESVSRVFASSG